MLRISIRLLLVVLLAGCPVFRCMAVGPVDAGVQVPPSPSPACASCCRTAGDCADRIPPNPAAPSDCPCECGTGDCICSGAIFESTGFELLITAHSLAGLPEPTEPIIRGTAASRADSADGGGILAPDGRSLRALICSLLC